MPDSVELPAPSSSSAAAPARPAPDGGAGPGDQGGRPGDQAVTSAAHQFAAAESGTPASAAAADFARSFDPAEGVDYKWVAAYARDRHAAALAAFKELDDKAGSVIGYIGGGAGILTLAAVAALTDPKIPAAVVFASVPSILAALGAAACAVAARLGRPVYMPPSIATAAEYAAFFRDRAEAAFAAQVHLCVALGLEVTDRKRRWVDWSLGLFVAATALLLLPLVTAVACRAGSPGLTP